MMVNHSAMWEALSAQALLTRSMALAPCWPGNVVCSLPVLKTFEHFVRAVSACCRDHLLAV